MGIPPHFPNLANSFSLEGSLNINKGEDKSSPATVTQNITVGEKTYTITNTYSKGKVSEKQAQKDMQKTIAKTIAVMQFGGIDKTSVLEFKKLEIDSSGKTLMYFEDGQVQDKGTFGKDSIFKLRKVTYTPPGQEDEVNLFRMPKNEVMDVYKQVMGTNLFKKEKIESPEDEQPPLEEANHDRESMYESQDVTPSPLASTVQPSSSDDQRETTMEFVHSKPAPQPEARPSPYAKPNASPQKSASPLNPFSSPPPIKGASTSKTPLNPPIKNQLPSPPPLIVPSQNNPISTAPLPSLNPPPIEEHSEPPMQFIHPETAPQPKARPSPYAQRNVSPQKTPSPLNSFSNPPPMKEGSTQPLPSNNPSPLPPLNSAWGEKHPEPIPQQPSTEATPQQKDISLFQQAAKNIYEKKYDTALEKLIKYHNGDEFKANTDMAETLKNLKRFDDALKYAEKAHDGAEGNKQKEAEILINKIRNDISIYNEKRQKRRGLQKE